MEQGLSYNTPHNIVLMGFKAIFHVGLIEHRNT